MRASNIDIDNAPFQPAHAAAEADGITRLGDSDAITRRYRLPGPHVTVLMPIPMPGQVGDDLAKRWSATMVDLRRLGADDAALGHLDAAVEALPRSGYDVLLTANGDDAAYCWLTKPSTAPFMRVDALPSLVPAFVEMDGRPKVVAAAIDRIGADLFTVDHAHLDAAGDVEGESERIHKSSGDGSDQARNQRHSEVIWDRNAHEVARTVAETARKVHASHVVLTGDRRAVDLVAGHLDNQRLTVTSVQAGGRHEPDTPLRLLAAAMAVATEAQARKVREDVDILTEELGQQDLAVDGEVHTLQAIADHRVAQLFVDADTWTERAHVDETIRAAVSDGGTVCAAPIPRLADGVAAMLRRPYHPS